MTFMSLGAGPRNGHVWGHCAASPNGKVIVGSSQSQSLARACSVFSSWPLWSLEHHRVHPSGVQTLLGWSLDILGTAKSERHHIPCAEPKVNWAENQQQGTQAHEHYLEATLPPPKELEVL